MKHISIWSSWLIYNFPTRVFYDQDGGISLAIGFHRKDKEHVDEYSPTYRVKVLSPASISEGIERAVSEAKSLLLRDFPESTVLN